MHSQRDEEKYILEAVKGVTNGTFLDIGAFDGKTFSNTLALVERGWSGVYVEAANTPFKALLDHVTKSGPERLHAVNAAIAPRGTGLVKFWQCDDMVSTMVESHRKLWSGPGSGTPYAASFMPTISYGELVKSTVIPIHEFDFVNLDVEGGNWAVFQEIMEMNATVKKCICVEFDDKKDAILALACNAGFYLARATEENVILVRG